MRLKMDERIRLGAAFLRGTFGRDWNKQINLEKLALANGTACILGQLNGDYNDACAKYRLTRKDAYDFGFIATPSEDGDGSGMREMATFNSLTRHWKKLIRTLR